MRSFGERGIRIGVSAGLGGGVDNDGLLTDGDVGGENASGGTAGVVDDAVDDDCLPFVGVDTGDLDPLAVSVASGGPGVVVAAERAGETVKGTGSCFDGSSGRGSSSSSSSGSTCATASSTSTSTVGGGGGGVTEGASSGISEDNLTLGSGMSSSRDGGSIVTNTC